MARETQVAPNQLYRLNNQDFRRLEHAMVGQFGSGDCGYQLEHIAGFLVVSIIGWTRDLRLTVIESLVHEWSLSLVRMQAVGQAEWVYVFAKSD